MHQSPNEDIQKLSYKQLTETMADLFFLIRDEYGNNGESKEYQRLVTEYERLSYERDQKPKDEEDE